MFCPVRAVVVSEPGSELEALTMHQTKLKPPKRGQSEDLDLSILARLQAIPKSPIADLKKQWRDLFEDTPPPYSRANLEHRLAYRIQELAYGGIDRQTRRLLDSLADEVEGRGSKRRQIADPRNPHPGTKLIREWGGTEHEVTVLKAGFEWQGRPYKSLSAIARAITGSNWNGYRFFGLGDRTGANT
jgi:hypothetical protein